MRPVVLMRTSLADRDEARAAREYFDVHEQRSRVESGSLVVGRYSVLPWYGELEADLRENGSRLINTWRQHRYLADLGQYVPDLRELTPLTWNRLEEIPEGGPFVLKGATNSKKFQWRTHMYAANKRAAIEVHARLCADGLVGDQEIYIRQFVPLHAYYEDVVGLPVTKEFRFFVLHGQVLCGGFYWANHAEEVAKIEGALPSIREVPTAFLDEVIRRVGDNATFYVVDVAQTKSGEWIVIELNDGQMSGLSCIDPGDFYGALSRSLGQASAGQGEE